MRPPSAIVVSGNRKKNPSSDGASHQHGTKDVEIVMERSYLSVKVFPFTSGQLSVEVVSDFHKVAPKVKTGQDCAQTDQRFGRIGGLDAVGAAGCRRENC